jgi:hypothetical protein
MGAGGVAMQDLQEEEVDGSDRVQDALSPAEAERQAEVAQGRGL